MVADDAGTLGQPVTNCAIRGSESPFLRSRWTRLSRRLLTSNGGKLMLLRLRLRLLRILRRRGQRPGVDVDLPRRGTVHTTE